jgi:hypothetical protein
MQEPSGFRLALSRASGIPIGLISFGVQSAVRTMVIQKVLCAGHVETM